MSVTILEVLQNARYNLSKAGHPVQRDIGLNQLKNAVGLLEKGYDLNDVFDHIIEMHDDIESVPEKG